MAAAPAATGAKPPRSDFLNVNRDTEMLNQLTRITFYESERTPAEEKAEKSTAAAASAAAAEKRDVDKRDEKADQQHPQQQPQQQQQPASSGKKSASNQIIQEVKKRGLRRKKRARRQEEIYTDKDRAAAVNMGTRDIKQSLKLKRKQDRSKNLMIPEESEPGTFLALAKREMVCGDVRIALGFMHKALELNPNDKSCLVARSKCYLLLEEPQLALEDALAALRIDPTFVNGIYQKADALYAMGEFEQSLVHFYRGLKMRPDLEEFRLGELKCKQAIENIIGQQISGPASRGASIETLKSARSSSSRRTPSSRPAKKQSKLLRELGSDKEFLDRLINDPNLHLMDQQSKKLQSSIEEGIRYLNTRQEFWKQQLPPNKKLC